MSVKTDKIIISAEVAGRKIILEAFEVPMDERMNESIYQGMQKCGQKLQEKMLEVADEYFRQTKARDWENKGRGELTIIA